MCKLGIEDVLNFDFMQKPSKEYFVRAVKDLIAIGAIDADTFTITPHGEKIMKLPVEPCLANALLLSEEHDCCADMIVIVSLISIDGGKVFYKPQNSNLREAATKRRRALTISAGDHLTLLNVYRKWTEDGGCGQKWCDDNFVYYQTMINAKKLRGQLRRQLSWLGVRVKSCGEMYQRVQAALAASFADKAASNSRGSNYFWLADTPERREKKATVSISTDSGLRSKSGQIVVCHKVVECGIYKNHQMQLVTEVQENMLPESVRAKLPTKKPFTLGGELVKAFRESETA